ncbi:MAG: hypothetical protein O7C59_09985 [Rickettsia endosymbiont of Ixodes persulcatus]|nr:hypothetical protein [Rickettsia endosymbiont of Ixodes persulcatus]MCZ6903556.1 hypothetical protein [Rickettsia endosymbiont of Ixodes persulcatus]MCZ6908448.1 hypothetical protein [Rickettsia endosymbiont of Ixodes persulcatus]MCZ6909975.1 hypothetical protein [Rickettsia endosymbiont of Ixodes persulcatus]MCZ6914733.1 hypothetical protein [Rickettsia endosymbiont of Ixodes persulcatus]
MENKEEESNILPEFIIDEEEEKRLEAENSKKELKLILITFAIILTSFLTFCYFFFNYIEEKAADYKLQQEAEAKKVDKAELK